MRYDADAILSRDELAALAADLRGEELPSSDELGPHDAAHAADRGEPAATLRTVEISVREMLHVMQPNPDQRRRLRLWLRRLGVEA